MSSKKQVSSKEIGSASRARRQFHALAPGFHAAFDLARAWRQAEIDAGGLARRDLAPLQKAHDERLKRLVLMLDAQYQEPALDESDRHALSTYLADAALDLLAEDEDPEIDEILARHEDILDDGEDGEPADMTPAEFKEYVKAMYGEDIDDDIVPGSPEADDLLDFLSDEQEEADEARERRSAAALEKMNVVGMRHEAQLETTLAQLVRELAEAPAAGDVDDLAQRIESAGAKRNLAQLIEIRLELERRGMAAHFPEKQLAECNKVLKEETRTLELEIAWHESELRQELREFTPGPLSPDVLLQELNSHIDEMRGMVATIDEELTELQDVQKLKAWLRRIDQPDFS